MTLHRPIELIIYVKDYTLCNKSFKQHSKWRSPSLLAQRGIANNNFVVSRYAKPLPYGCVLFQQNYITEKGQFVTKSITNRP